MHRLSFSMASLDSENSCFVLPLVATQIGNMSQLQRLTVKICLSYRRKCSTQGKQLLKEMACAEDSEDDDDRFANLD